MNPYTNDDDGAVESPDQARGRREPDLHHWKQVASYLGVSEKTARNWGKNGLPVHRVRRRVYAYKDELDDWLRRQDGPPPKAGGRRGWPLLAAAGAAVLLIIALLAARGDSTLETAVMDGQTLRALGKNGETLWARTFDSFNMTMLHPFNQRPSHLVIDVDEDGDREVLFNFHSLRSKEESGRLICFESDGSVLWEFEYGRRLTVGDRFFEPVFGLAFVHHLVTEAGSLLLTVSRHATWFPARITLIDPATGSLLEEYLHPGFIYTIAFFDYDGDGADEIVLGGVNNPGAGIGYPSLALLDIPFGDRPTPPDTEPRGYFGSANAKELAYYLLPQPDSYRARDIGAAVTSIAVQSPGRLQIAVGTPPNDLLYYYLDEKFDILDLKPANIFVSNHNLLAHEGLLDHSFGTRDLERLRRIVRFPTAPDANHPATAALVEGG